VKKLLDNLLRNQNGVVEGGKDLDGVNENQVVKGCRI